MSQGHDTRNESQQVADRVMDTLDAYSELMLVYLFGSRAGGRPGPESDYDFGVVTGDTEGAPALRARLAHELAGVLGTDRVDIVMLHRAPVELAYAVISQGTLIYQRDEATRVEFEARIMSLYGDYLPVLRAQRSDICRGGNHAARVQRYREALGRTEREIGQIRASESQASH